MVGVSLHWFMAAVTHLSSTRSRQPRRRSTPVLPPCSCRSRTLRAALPMVSEIRADTRPPWLALARAARILHFYAKPCVNPNQEPSVHERVRPAPVRVAGAAMAVRLAGSARTRPRPWRCPRDCRQPWSRKSRLPNTDRWRGEREQGRSWLGRITP